MAYAVMGITCVLLFFVFFFYEVVMNKKIISKKVHEIEKSFGKKSDREYSYDDLDRIKKFFYKYKDEDSIDDITANDLDIDEIFMSFNYSSSAAGDDYLYYRLRTPRKDREAMNFEEAELTFLSNNKEVRAKLINYFFSVGRIRKISFVDFMNVLNDAKLKSLLPDYFCLALIALSIALIFYNSAWGVMALVGVFIYNIVSYYKEHGEIEVYMLGCSYITSFIQSTKKLDSMSGTPLEKDINKIKELSSDLSKITRFYSVIASSGKQTGAGNPLDIIGDYFRMAFHIDIIIFYKMLKGMQENSKKIDDLYFAMGKLEAYLSICSMREAVPGYSIPKIDNNLTGVKATNIYHPLLSNPVKNDFETKNNVLITGSNASGKSTFLKSVAINMIMASSINTVTGDYFEAGDYHVLSSMSIRDDITQGDSYFMAEIKAFKRIIDYVKSNPDKKTMVFTDELLRGTNTVERIAACNSILKNMVRDNTLVFAATHDIELTELLEPLYTNYHFDEDFVNDDVIFNYKIKDGKATSKNAIKLLNVMGFDESIVKEAKDLADKFTAEGTW